MFEDYIAENSARLLCTMDPAPLALDMELLVDTVVSVLMNATDDMAYTVHPVTAAPSTAILPGIFIPVTIPFNTVLVP